MALAYLSDIMNEQCHEDGKTKLRVCVIGGEGDETFWELVQCYCDACLETDREECVCGDVMVVSLRWIIWRWRGG